MKTIRRIMISVTLLLTAATATFAASAHLGTWKLNESKSKFSGAKNHTVTYTEAKGDKMMLTVEGVDKDGKAVKWTWEGKFDGKPYKIKGSAMADHMAVKMVDDHANELTMMKDGKVVMTGMVKVAKDGKSRVVTTTSTDANGKKHTDKAYYDKQ
jgi:ribosomal protein S11